MYNVVHNSGLSSRVFCGVVISIINEIGTTLFLLGMMKLFLIKGL